MADFRSDRMASPEGEGRAKATAERVWDKYYATNKALNKPLFEAFPWIRNVVKGQAGSAAVDVFGFWVAWQLFGGFDGLQKHLGMSRSTIYRRIAAFRAVFGEHPDVYEMPGITVDVAAFYAAAPTRQKKQASE